MDDPPATRQPAPGALALVQDFVNTAELPGGYDELADVPATVAWLAARGYGVGPGRGPAPSHRRDPRAPAHAHRGELGPGASRRAARRDSPGCSTRRRSTPWSPPTACGWRRPLAASTASSPRCSPPWCRAPSTAPSAASRCAGRTPASGRSTTARRTAAGRGAACAPVAAAPRPRRTANGSAPSRRVQRGRAAVHAAPARRRRRPTAAPRHLGGRAAQRPRCLVRRCRRGVRARPAVLPARGHRLAAPAAATPRARPRSGHGQADPPAASSAGSTWSLLNRPPACARSSHGVLPGVRCLDGTAEAIPLPDASVDAVLCAQAWHWVDPQRAVPEVARVLSPGGRLGLVWNKRDERVDWVRLLGAPCMATTIAPVVAGGRLAVRAAGAARRRVAVPGAARGGSIDLVASRSYVITLPGGAARALLAEVSRLLEHAPSAGGRRGDPRALHR